VEMGVELEVGCTNGWARKIRKWLTNMAPQQQLKLFLFKFAGRH